MTDYIREEIETDNMRDDDNAATVDSDLDCEISPCVELTIITVVLVAMLFACVGASYFFGWVV